MNLDANNITLEDLGGTAEQEVAATPAQTSKLGNPYQAGSATAVEERALALLGSGINAESVAAALGVTPARISQLLADEDFASKVATLRYTTLQEHNLRDDEYDALEDKLLEKLNKSLPLMVRPDTILKAINTVNGAKRRGQNSPDQSNSHQKVVTLILPAVIVEKFVTTLDNQVTKAGDQELLTMSSNNLLTKVESAQNRLIENVPVESDEQLQPQQREHN